MQHSATLADWTAALPSAAEVLARLQQAREQALAAVGLGIWIHLCPDERWAEQIAGLERRLLEFDGSPAARARYPLLGVPFAVKDNIDIAGEPTTAACPAFSHLASRTATVVSRLLDAGALWLGKTNLDQFATGLVGTRSPYGRPASVFDASRVSGGSSSGSAVAVARGIVPFALGTDTAGSGRVPAGFNGLVGLKPTPGRVSTAGVLPACRTLDCVSIFAHRVEDAALVLAVIEGADPDDPYSAFAPGKASLPARLRIGVPRQPALDASIGYDLAWQRAIDDVRARGHTLVEIDQAPLNAVAELLYDGPWVAERHAACRSLFDNQPQALEPSVRAIIAGALRFSATDAFEARYRLRALSTELQAWWQGLDLLMVPTAPTHPRIADVDADPIATNARLGTYTNFVNLLGWCALALPAGQADAGLPFGITFVAPAGQDAALAGALCSWQAAATGPQSPPPARSVAVEPSLTLAVVGAHLAGLPLNGQLTERGAKLVEATRTAPCYRLFALPGTRPPKPGLVRSAEGGASIEVEVWALPQAAAGSFLALIPAPLGLGTIELADGRQVHGFLCESHALAGATEITALGGWRAYLASLAGSPA